jgi:hypothetical protein
MKKLSMIRLSTKSGRPLSSAMSAKCLLLADFVAEVGDFGRERTA